MLNVASGKKTKKERDKERTKRIDEIRSKIGHFRVGYPIDQLDLFFDHRIAEIIIKLQDKGIKDDEIIKYLLDEENLKKEIMQRYEETVDLFLKRRRPKKKKV